MTIKEEILLGSGLLLENGEEDDESKMFEKNGKDDVCKGYYDRDWKLIERSIQFIKDPANRRLLKLAIKNKDWNPVRKVFTYLGC